MNVRRAHEAVQNGGDHLNRIDNPTGRGAGLGFIHFIVDIIADKTRKDFLV